MKKYAVIGSHGVGKTVLTGELFLRSIEEFKNKNIKILGEVVRHCPFPINDKSSVDGGHWIVTTQIAHELKAKAEGADILLCDRAAIDPIMYLFAGNRFSILSFRALYDFARSWLMTYDKVIFIKSSHQIPLDADGFRDTDKKFQMLVDARFETFLHSYQIEFAKDIMTVHEGDLKFDSPEKTFDDIYNFLFWNEA